MLDLVLILTTGCVKGLPSKAGIARIMAALRAADSSRETAIGIVGGYRDDAPSEAEVYAEWLRGHCGSEYSRLALTSGTSCCTARDLWRANGEIMDCLDEKEIDRSRAKIGVATYPEHFDRTLITLLYLGYRRENIVLIESHEEFTYSPLLERVLCAVTRLDPRWKWWPISGLFQLQASRRASLRDTLSR